MNCVCSCVWWGGGGGVGVWLCWLWKGHFYVAPCDVAHLRFGGGGVGGWISSSFGSIEVSSV